MNWAAVNRRVAILGLAAALAGCSGQVPAPIATAPVGLATDAEGLIALQNGLRVDFGRTQSSTIASATKLMGAAPDQVVTNSECGAGPLDIATWNNRLTLLFQGGNFRGWVANSRKIAAANGLHPGMTRQQITDSGLTLRTTTLGSEFDAGGVFGLIENDGPRAKVTTMWAGTTCFFR